MLNLDLIIVTSPKVQTVTKLLHLTSRSAESKLPWAMSSITFSCFCLMYWPLGKHHSISSSYQVITYTVECGSQGPESNVHCMEREGVFLVRKSVTSSDNTVSGCYSNTTSKHVCNIQDHP